MQCRRLWRQRQKLSLRAAQITNQQYWLLMYGLPHACFCRITAGSSAQPIQLLRADPTPIHSVAWQPHKRWWLTGDTEEEAAAVLDGQSSSASSSGSAASSTSAAHSCRYFLTASNIGNVRVWDAQDVLQPLHERVVSRNAINAALWMGPPHMVVVASADGVLRQIWLDAGAQATTITTQVADGEQEVCWQGQSEDTCREAWCVACKACWLMQHTDVTCMNRLLCDLHSA